MIRKLTDRWLWVLGFLIFSTLSASSLKSQQLINQDSSEIQYMKTDDGVEFGIWTGDGKPKAAPLLFILSATIEESLGNKYFRQCGDDLGKNHGWLCVSIDLPFHGKLREPGKPNELDGWARAAERGNDFVTDNNLRMRKVLNYLINVGYADTTSLAVCGTSRGGYLALQFAAFEPRVKSVAAFAPVTDLLALREFRKIGQINLLPVMNLCNQADLLAHKNVWIVIGDQDERVGTKSALSFLTTLLNERARSNSKSNVEFNLLHEPRGHTTPEGARDRAVQWMLANDQ